MSQLDLLEILKILTSYANTGASTTQMANIYETLKCSLPNIKEERTKEEKETEKKILSLIAGKKDKEQNINYEVQRWVHGADEFTIAQMYAELCITTKMGKDSARHVLHKMSEKGIIENVGRKTGNYRKVKADSPEQMWWEADGKALPIRFPMGVHNYAKIFPGNIILLEGQKSQGKSSFAIEFSRLNENVFPEDRILYQNVEMANDEIKDRIKAYEDDNIWTRDKWIDRIKFTRRHDSWWDLILPNGLNVVDYLIEYNEPYKLPQFIFEIHKKLKNGIALVVVQRDPLKPYPSGGRATRDIPRLILSLVHHKIRLEDVKTFWEGLPHNPTGLVCKYKKVHWWKFIKDGEWHDEEEEKYEQYKTKKEPKQPLKVVDKDFVHEED